MNTAPRPVFTVRGMVCRIAEFTILGKPSARLDPHSSRTRSKTTTLGALVEAALGRWTGVGYLGFLGLGGLAGALYARRSGSRDVTRLNALEWRDERDRNLAKSAFAVVGAASLLMVMAQFIIVDVADPLRVPR
jgi:hypothetical protein